MDIKNLGHIGFNVSDWDAAIKFYCEGLGFKRIYTVTFADLYRQMLSDMEAGTAAFDVNEAVLNTFRGMGDTPWHSYLQIVPGQCLELFYNYNDKPLAGDLSGKCCYSHCAIIVDDLEKAWEELEEKGIKADTQIQIGPDFTKQFWLSDPDGNKLELMEYTDKSFQMVKTIWE
jgi:catechol 2,3-dioxygenase-like lactoylglutathione lyase family enzyme